MKLLRLMKVFLAILLALSVVSLSVATESPPDLRRAEVLRSIHRHAHEHSYHLPKPDLKTNPFYFLAVEERHMPFRLFSSEDTVPFFLMTILRFSLVPILGTAVLLLFKPRG